MAYKHLAVLGVTSLVCIALLTLTYWSFSQINILAKDVDDLRRSASISSEVIKLSDCRAYLLVIQRDISRSREMMLAHIARPSSLPDFREYHPLGELLEAANLKASHCVRSDFANVYLSVGQDQMNSPAPGEPTDNSMQTYRYRKYYIQSCQAQIALSILLRQVEIRLAFFKQISTP